MDGVLGDQSVCPFVVCGLNVVPKGRKIHSSPAFRSSSAICFEAHIEGMLVANIAQQGSGGPALARRKLLPTLPSKLPTAAVVEHTGRTLAIDTAGALFRSDDAGATWHFVPTQWRGRALRASTSQRPTAPQPEAATNTAGIQFATASLRSVLLTDCRFGRSLYQP